MDSSAKLLTFKNKIGPPTIQYRSNPINRETWDQYEETIKKKYLDEGLTLKAVQAYLEKECRFYAT